jgi:uncharacterized membrane protein
MSSATLYQWLLFGHLLGAMVWLGGGVVLAVLSAAALRGDEHAVARFARSLRVVGPAVLAPATVLTLGFGVWLVLDSEAWDFGQAWVIAALALIAAVIVVGAGFQARTALAAERAAAGDDHVEARRQLTRWIGGYALALVLLVITVWDMVFKPGL